jgi:UV DNA damage endonuclease
MSLSQAKDKEQAVFELYRMYGLEEVILENLRPEKKPEEMTLKTLGRKSSKR